MPKEIVPDGAQRSGPSRAPKPVGAYSQAVRAGGFVFVSGQIPVVPATGELITDGIAAATRQCMENIGAVLDDAGLSFDDIVTATVFLKDMGDFAAMNEIYAGYFAEAPPARAAVQVAALPKGAPIEIQVLAKEA